MNQPLIFQGVLRDLQIYHWKMDGWKMPQPGDAQPGDCLGEVKISHSHTIHATGIQIYIYIFTYMNGWFPWYSCICKCTIMYHTWILWDLEERVEISILIFQNQKKTDFFPPFFRGWNKKSTPHLGNTKHFTCTFTICRGDDRGMP